MPLLDTVLSLVAPHTCLVCEREGSLLCAWCKWDALLPVPSKCYRCHKLTPEFSVCVTCRRRSPLRHVWVATSYEAIGLKLLHTFKFERAQSGASAVAEAMVAILPNIPADTIVVPVPTANNRIRERGYDHAARIARSLSRQTNLVWDKAVARFGNTRQVGASRQQRQSQLVGAFMVVHPKRIKGANILIVDDVVTTGATLEAMARELKAAGAKSVSAVVFAQKQ